MELKISDKSREIKIEHTLKNNHKYLVIVKIKNNKFIGCKMSFNPNFSSLTDWKFLHAVTEKIVEIMGEK